MSDAPEPRKPRPVWMPGGAGYPVPGGPEWAPGGPTGADGGPPRLAASRSGGRLLPDADPDPAAGAGSSAPPDRAATPGLYDLPSLLARIWSVPIDRRGTPPAPPAPAPPPTVPVAPTPPTVRSSGSLSDWTSLAYSEQGSLPLAAVPTFALTPPARPSPSTPTGSSAPLEPAPGHFLAWRHPPCHVAFDLPGERRMRCVREIAGIASIEQRLSSARRAIRPEVWMRPASPEAVLRRSELLAGR